MERRVAFCDAKAMGFNGCDCEHRPRKQENSAAKLVRCEELELRERERTRKRRYKDVCCVSPRESDAVIINKSVSRGASLEAPPISCCSKQIAEQRDRLREILLGEAIQDHLDGGGRLAP